MAKIKKSAGDTAAGNGRKKTGEAPALIICRNKHWRFISSFHGPWLQLPPEVLESLAHSNFLSPRPHPIDPAVFYDVLKIRRLVDEATTLAVRATSGLTSAALNNAQGLLGPAAALGLGVAGGGTLSRERKHRMRELATGKLAAAYRLDEIAASVATMQGASTLEDVAALVLQRSPADADAKYVHFFHEKIPSRMLAQSTPLAALDDVLAERPADGSALRTRALTRLFKDDLANSARDLTAALAAARHRAATHRQGRQLVPATAERERERDRDRDRDWRNEARVPDDDQPSSLEAQLLFHRAGVYLAVACRHVAAALDGLQAQEARDAAGVEDTADEAAARLARADSRKQLRQNAKRALRDYTAFLAHFDYTPGIDVAAAEALLRQFQADTRGSHANTNGNGSHTNRSHPALHDAPSNALAPYKKTPAHAWPKLPPPPVFTLNQLFDAVPPAALPPYPPPPNTPPSPLPTNESVTYHPLLAEALHSLLLTHALLQTPPKELLRHAHNAARLARRLDGYPVFLAARSPARGDWVEVLRRGANWIGLGASWESLCRPASSSASPRAPSSALTRPAPTTNTETPESPAQRRDRHKHEAILDALADERVVDEASFQRAVRAREVRFQDDERRDAEAAASQAALPNGAATRAITDRVTSSHTGTETETETDADADAAGEKDKEKEKDREPSTRFQPDPQHAAYPIATDRADAVARWVRDAAPLVAEGGKGGAKGKGRRRKKASVREGGEGVEGVEGGVGRLAIQGGVGGE